VLQRCHGSFHVLTTHQQVRQQPDDAVAGWHYQQAFISAAQRQRTRQCSFMQLDGADQADAAYLLYQLRKLLL
jgi:hypothetical protein